jgi:hypothetical protein
MNTGIAELDIDLIPENRGLVDDVPGAADVKTTTDISAADVKTTTDISAADVKTTTDISAAVL